MSNLKNRRAYFTLIVLCSMGFVFPASAQLVTNLPPQFKIKVVLYQGKEGAGVSSTSINLSPESTPVNVEVGDIGTSPGREYELKWKYLGRKGNQDLYHFTFTRMTKAGVSDKTTTLMALLFNGQRETILKDELHTVIVDTPSAEDLKK